MGSLRGGCMKQIVLVLGGALAGGALGYAACWWLAKYGFYSVVLPGGLLGLGAGIAKNRSVVLAVVCGRPALGLGLFAEWSLFPWEKDGSLGFFLLHIPDLGPVTLLMIAAGGFIGFWVPFRRIEKRPRAEAGGKTPSQPEGKAEP